MSQIKISAAQLELRRQRSAPGVRKSRAVGWECCGWAGATSTPARGPSQGQGEKGPGAVAAPAADESHNGGPAAGAGVRRRASGRGDVWLGLEAERLVEELERAMVGAVASGAADG